MADEEIQESVPGYSGSPEEGKGPSQPPEGSDPSMMAVVSPVGVTEPTIEYQGDGVTPIAPEDALAPKNAPHPQAEADLENAPEGSVTSPAGVTPPTLVYQGDGVTLEGEEKAQAKGGNGAEEANYEDFTVAELKGIASERGVAIKSDWNKTEIIEALEADDAGGK